MRLRLHAPAVLLAAVPLAVPATAAPYAPREKVNASSNLKAVAQLPWRGGTDLELTKIGGRRYVVAGAQNNYNPTASPGLRVVDVTNPAKPKVAGFLPCNTSQNDIQVKGRYAFIAVDFNAKSDREGRDDCFSQAGDVTPAGGVVVVDIGNPRKPRAIGFVKVTGAAHNTTVHPTKPLLYVSDSELATSAELHIVDWSKPRAPKVVKSLELSPGDSIHDITFKKDGTRAYVAAGFTHTLVVDTSAPLEPKVLGRIYDPAINFHHQADPTPNGKYLLITDELAGAEGNGYCPGGGIHVYDISNEAAPVKMGAYFIPDTFPSAAPGPRPVVGNVTVFRCTAHVMRIAPDSKTLVMGWYSQGIQVLDISGLPGVSAGAGGTDRGIGIKRLGHWTIEGADTWSAKMDERGYIFTGDTQRGMDVVRYSGKAAAVSPGLWLTPAQALARAAALKARQPARSYFCYEPATRLGR